KAPPGPSSPPRHSNAGRSSSRFPSPGPRLLGRLLLRALVPDLLQDVFKVVLQAAAVFDSVEPELQPHLLEDLIRLLRQQTPCLVPMNQLEECVVIRPPPQRRQKFSFQVHAPLSSWLLSATSTGSPRSPSHSRLTAWCPRGLWI